MHTNLSLRINGLNLACFHKYKLNSCRKTIKDEVRLYIFQLYDNLFIWKIHIYKRFDTKKSMRTKNDYDIL